MQFFYSFAGWFACSTILTVVKSAIITVWLCLAEDPKAFYSAHPAEYDGIKAHLQQCDDYRQIAM